MEDEGDIEKFQCSIDISQLFELRVTQPYLQPIYSIDIIDSSDLYAESNIEEVRRYLIQVFWE